MEPGHLDGERETVPERDITRFSVPFCVFQGVPFLVEGGEGRAGLTAEPLAAGRLCGPLCGRCRGDGSSCRRPWLRPRAGPWHGRA